MGFWGGGGGFLGQRRGSGYWISVLDMGTEIDLKRLLPVAESQFCRLRPVLDFAGQKHAKSNQTRPYRQ